MDEPRPYTPLSSREAMLHALYEAAELEHNLMCTYLYAAFSLKDGAADGLSADEADAVGRWRRTLLDVSIEEMGHLAAVWNITAGLGGTPRLGRTNFPIDPGYLPASVVVKLAPFTADTLQHFVFLERPHGSPEPDGPGFPCDRTYRRGEGAARLTPMGIDYETVGDFYAAISAGLRNLVAQYGEGTVFDGDPTLQLSPSEIALAGAKPVRCIKTALAAFDAIVLQGEGAPKDAEGSHFQRFVAIRTELEALRARNPDFTPAHPAATNPVLRRPPRPEGRVWIENAAAAAVVDLANASYGLMLRLLGYAYGLRTPSAEKAMAVDIGIGLMRAVAPLAEYAARLPAGPHNPDCHAGISFTTLRDASPLPAGRAGRRAFIERLAQLDAAAQALAADGDPRTRRAADVLAALSLRAQRDFDAAAAEDAGRAAPMPSAATAAPDAPPATVSAAENGIERVRGDKIEIEFEARRCIHSRFCVTGAPQVFLANTPGSWIRPDAMDAARIVEIAHACPSGAVRYHRLDGQPDEGPPPVNLASVREAGPYAFRGELQIDGRPGGFRVTLCRCGASKNKPYCDGSHHGVGFAATGEPPTQAAEMLPARNGTLRIDPELNGPLAVRGNLEIISGTGRVVARVVSARLCRCGGSANKPFCDGTHAKIGFVSTV